MRIRDRIPVGVVFPQTEIGSDPVGMREFAQAAEDLGFSHIVAYDHVLGADLTNRPDWDMPYHLDSMFQEPVTLFAYLAACTSRIRLSTGVIILPQRQVVLFGKQAATLDLLSSGRLRVVVGLGWNKVEYNALGYTFEGRVKRFEDQIRLLRRLWTERSFSDSGENYEIVEAGIHPLPPQQPIPIWLGGPSDAAMKRAARVGDGWFPTFIPPELAEETVGKFRSAIEGYGRDPANVGFEILTMFCDYGSTNRRSVKQIADTVEKWRIAGANAVCVDTMRMGASGASAHIAIMKDLAAALNMGA